MEDIKHIGPKLRIIHNAVDQKINLRVQEMELTSAQIFVLHFISQNPDRDIYQRDIENRFELSHATVSGLIARLEAKGFLECEPGQKDKRYKRLCVTEKARCCDALMKENIDNVEQQLLKGFSEEDMERLNIYFDKMLSNLGMDMTEVRRKRR